MLQKSITIGYGANAFAKARDCMLNFTLSNSLDWVRIVSTRNGADTTTVGSDLATVTRFYGLPIWSTNPCRVTTIVRHGILDYITTRGNATQGRTRQHVGRFSQIAFATLQGHLLEGEEALRVFTVHRDSPSGANRNSIPSNRRECAANTNADEVIFEITSYSKGSDWLGRALMPLIRPLQRQFMIDHCNAARKLLATRVVHHGLQ